VNLSTRKARWIAAAAALSCAAIAAPAIALAAPSFNASTAAPASSALGPACETPNLVIWLNTNGKAAAGSAFFKLNFTNLSGHSCTVNGFPFLFAVILKGVQLGRRAGFNGTRHTVTIGNGQTKTATIQIVDVLNFPPSRCKPTTAAGFKVFPPNQTRAKMVPFPFGACGRAPGAGPQFLFVGPVK